MKVCSRVQPRAWTQLLQRRACSVPPTRPGEQQRLKVAEKLRETSTARRSKAQSQVHYGAFQRSKIDRAPNVLVLAFAFGISGGLLSIIAFNDMARPRLEARDDDDDLSDSLLTVTEPISGSKFPLTLESYSDPGSTHWLVTKTVRCMLGMCSLDIARAYSYAIYFSSDAAMECKDMKKLEDVRGKVLPFEMCQIETEFGDDDAKKEPDFIEASKFSGAKPGYVFKLDDGRLGYHKDNNIRIYRETAKEMSYPSLVLRLMMLRDQNADHIANGFDRTLLWRVRYAQGQNRKGKGKDALRHLTQLVKRQQSFKKGDILDFVRLPEGFVEVRVNGERKLVVQSEAFSWAIFDAYMGEKGHMSKESREELLSRVQEISSLL